MQYKIQKELIKLMDVSLAASMTEWCKSYVRKLNLLPNFHRILPLIQT